MRRPCADLNLTALGILLRSLCTSDSKSLADCGAAQRLAAQAASSPWPRSVCAIEGCSCVRADTRLKALTLPAHVVDVLLQLRLPTQWSLHRSTPSRLSGRCQDLRDSRACRCAARQRCIQRAGGKGSQSDTADRPRHSRCSDSAAETDAMLSAFPRCTADRRGEERVCR